MYRMYTWRNHPFIACKLGYISGIHRNTPFKCCANGAYLYYTALPLAN